MSQRAVAAAAEKAEAAWTEHYNAIEAARQSIRDALAHNAAATGVGMGPQLDAAASCAVDAVVEHAEMLAIAKQAKSHALAYERERDNIEASLPPPPPDKPPPRLASGEPTDIRAWLSNAKPGQVHDALAEISGDVERVAWANQLMAWIQQDGNRKSVIDVVRAAQPGGLRPEPGAVPGTEAEAEAVPE